MTLYVFRIGLYCVTIKVISFASTNKYNYFIGNHHFNGMLFMVHPQIFIPRAIVVYA